MPLKLRDRFYAKKMMSQETYKEQLADTYMRRYTDISHETAEFYKSNAAQLYLTEQFCKGSKYMTHKHQQLVNESLDSIKPKPKKTKRSSRKKRVPTPEPPKFETAQDMAKHELH